MSLDAPTVKISVRKHDRRKAMQFMTIVYIFFGVAVIGGVVPIIIALIRHGIPSDGWPELRAKYPCDATPPELTWIRFRTMQMNPSFGQGSSPRSQYKGAYDGKNYFFQKTDLGHAAKRTACIPTSAVELDNAIEAQHENLEAVARAVSPSNLPDVCIRVEDYEHLIRVDGETFKKIRETS
jgi:hypothetical protein